jgi:hypothetical protein
MKAIRNFFARISLMVLAMVLLLVVVGMRMAYAQTGAVAPPSIDQIVSGLMQAIGTWIIMYLVNIARVKYNIIPGSIFLVIVLNVLGLAVSWLQSYLSVPGHSWVLSFFATFGAVFASQLQAQLNDKVGPAQYKFGPVEYLTGVGK